MIEQRIKIILYYQHLMYHLLHTISTLLYEIVKVSKEFPDSRTMNIQHPLGSKAKVINIPK